jgi:hypothetical protein
VAAVADKFSTPTYTKTLHIYCDRSLSSSGAGLPHWPTGSVQLAGYAQWALDCCHRVGIPIGRRPLNRLSLSDIRTSSRVGRFNTVLATENYEQLTGRAPRDWHDAVRNTFREKVAPKGFDNVSLDVCRNTRLDQFARCVDCGLNLRE